MSAPSVSLRQLSPTAQTLVKTRRIDSSLPPADWAAVLGEVEAFERCNDSRRSVAGLILFAAIVGLIAAIVLSIAAIPRYAMIVIPLTILAVIAASVYYHRVKQLDLGHGLRKVVAPLFAVLREDLHPSKPVRLQLDFRGATNDKIVRQGKVAPPQHSRIHSIKQTVYEDPWCTLRGQMAAGHRLQVALSTTAVKLSRTARSASGKYKTKTKWKKVGAVAASLTPAADSMAVDPSRLGKAGPHGKCTVKSGEKGETVRLARKFKSKSADGLKEPVALEQVVEVLFALCRTLAPTGGSPNAK